MKRSLIVSTSLVGLSLAATPAMAQQVEEIVITATKRAQSVQDVPIAVTVVTPKQLEEQGVVNIQNLTSVAPSFSTSNAQTAAGTVVLRMRGVGTTSNNIGFESAVGVFIDGVYQSRPGIALGEFVDVERVEVLRGPQGTLFGRNTSAGALSVTNVRPDLEEFGGFMNATVGSYGHKSVQAAVNMPLGENAAARVTGAYRQRDGFIDVVDGSGTHLGETNEIDQFMVRGQLGFETPKGTSGRVILDFSNSNASCCGSVEVQRAGVEGGLTTFAGLGPRGGMAGRNAAASGDANDTSSVERALDDLLATANKVPENETNQAGIALELEVPVTDGIDATYIGSFRAYDTDNSYDSDFSGLDILNVSGPTSIGTMTHELRFQGDAMDGRLDWLVGGYYADEKINQLANFDLGSDYDRLSATLIAGTLAGLGATNIFAFGATPYTTLTGVDPVTVSAGNTYKQDSESWSLFTHNIFEVNDELSLTLGLRYSDESKEGSFVQTSSNNNVCPTLTGQLGAIGGQVVGAGVAPANAGRAVNTIFALGCLAFTAPADLLPQAVVLPLPRSFNDDFKDDELIYTAKASYKFTPEMSGYASFTHGYKSGGFNLDSTAAIPTVRPSVAAGDPTFESELVDAYEIGLKTKLFDNRVSLNAALFMMDFENFQVLEFTGAQFQTFNVPKAESKGIEVEAAGYVTENISFNAGLTLTDAQYPSDCADASAPLRVQNLCGFELTNAPKTVGILGAKYENTFANGIGYFLGGQARYDSDRRTSTQGRLVPGTQAALGNTALNPYDIQEAYTKINVRAGILSDENGWAVEAWSTNLTDEVTRGVTFNTPLRSGRSAYAQEPQMYGMTVRQSF